MRHCGRIFQKDFGQIFGKFKSKFGIKRERSPFVFTPEMAFIIAGRSVKHERSENYNVFLKYATQAYEILRRNSRQISALAKLMISAGLPELSRSSDIQYMLDSLKQDSTSEEASNLLMIEINTTLSTKFRGFDNLVHT